jgi:hypothetical protein
MTEVALALWHHGEAGRARGLLERAVHDLGRLAGPDHDLRIRAITSLRDLLVQESDYEEAGVVQMELLECQMRRWGPEHPETLATRADLAAILLQRVAGKRVV